MSMCVYATNPKRSKILLANPSLAWFLLGFAEPVLCKQYKYKEVLALLAPFCWPWIPALLAVKLLKESGLCHPEASAQAGEMEKAEPTRERHPSLGRRNGNAAW